MTTNSNNSLGFPIKNLPITQKKIISIHGVPRSGTSWLGQIFNSHPSVAYRFQPLFAYRFKDRINLGSTQEEIYQFLQELFDVEGDEFILDDRVEKEGIDFAFIKDPSPDYLVMKEVRYHHLIEKFLTNVEKIKILGIVRNPCAVINSWLKAPKEFKKEWDAMQEWRYAPKKNLGKIEEFNGFEKWKEVASLFIRLEKTYPSKFLLVHYEDLNSRPEEEIHRIFNFVELTYNNQVNEFIKLSRSIDREDPYSILRKPQENDRWKKELDGRITIEITAEIKSSELNRFMR